MLGQSARRVMRLDRRAAFRPGLGEGGFVEGGSVAIELRWTSGENVRLPEPASDLVVRRCAAMAVLGLPFRVLLATADGLIELGRLRTFVPTHDRERAAGSPTLQGLARAASRAFCRLIFLYSGLPVTSAPTQGGNGTSVFSRGISTSASTTPASRPS